MTPCAWIRLGYVISGGIDAYLLAERKKRTWAYFDDPLQIFMTLHLLLMAAIFITWAFLVLHPARRFVRYFLHFRIIFIVLSLTGYCQVVSFRKCHFFDALMLAILVNALNNTPSFSSHLAHSSPLCACAAMWWWRLNQSPTSKVTFSNSKNLRPWRRCEAGLSRWYVYVCVRAGVRNNCECVLVCPCFNMFDHFESWIALGMWPQIYFILHGVNCFLILGIYLNFLRINHNLAQASICVFLCVCMCIIITFISDTLLFVPTLGTFLTMYSTAAHGYSGADGNRH